jgi:hypothetical protein
LWWKRNRKEFKKSGWNSESALWRVLIGCLANGQGCCAARLPPDRRLTVSCLAEKAARRTLNAPNLSDMPKLIVMVHIGNKWLFGPEQAGAVRATRHGSRSGGVSVCVVPMGLA